MSDSETELEVDDRAGNSEETDTESDLEPSTAGKAGSAPAPGKHAHDLMLPFGRIKKMVRQGEGVKAVSADATFMIAKAAEMFVDGLAAKSFRNLADRTEVMYSDIAEAVSEWPSCKFLADIVPQKTSVQQLLQKQKQHARAAQGAAKRRKKAATEPPNQT